MQSGADDAAAASLAAAKAMSPESPDVVAFSARRQLAGLRDELLAQAAAGKAPRLADDDPRGLAADQQLERARAEHPEHAELWLAQAEWDHARARVLPALRAYRQAQRLRPNLPASWLGAARLLREHEKYADAANYARDGLQQVEDPALRQELALALVGQGQFDDAELQLEAYLRVRPEDRDAAKILANLLIGRAMVRLVDRGARAEVKRLVERALAYNTERS